MTAHNPILLSVLVNDQVWHVQQPLKFGPMSISTRMTVVRLADGTLWVHSPVQPTPGLTAELSNLGVVRYVVAPNKSHHLFFCNSWQPTLPQQVLLRTGCQASDRTWLV